MTPFGGTSRIIRGGWLNHLKAHQLVLAKRLFKRGIVKYGRADFPPWKDEAHFLPRPDVIDRCTVCGDPIFNQSKNVKVTKGRHVDGSDKLRHVKCYRLLREAAA